jgi:hypothetical protein
MLPAKLGHGRKIRFKPLGAEDGSGISPHADARAHGGAEFEPEFPRLVIELQILTIAVEP